MPTEQLKQDAERYLMPTYARQPISIVRGRGSRVYDMEGREYIDFVAGIAVNVLGHAHPDLTLAIQKQAQHLLHASNLYYTEPQVRLAQALVDHSFADKVFFCNSGAEANEAAIKLARLSRPLQPPVRKKCRRALPRSFRGSAMRRSTT